MNVYKKIAFKSLGAWIKVGVTGILFSIICITAGFILLFSTYPEGAKFYQVFSVKPFTILLILFSAIAIALYIALASKAALMTLINQVWNNKLADFIVPKVYDYISRLTAQQPNWLKSITGKKFTSILVDVATQDGTLNKIQRTVFKYGIRHSKLQEKDFINTEQDLPRIVSNKVQQSIQNTTKPSYILFWLLFGIHLILLILTVVVG